MNNDGGGEAESLDQMWDAILTAGRRVYGVAVDDAHHFKKFGPTFSNPGRGWVMVRAGGLEAGKVAEALRAGEFYASTGVVLEDVERSKTGLRVKIGQTGDFKYTTYFVGAGGEVLAKSGGMEMGYTFKGNEKVCTGAGGGIKRERGLDAAGLAGVGVRSDVCWTGSHSIPRPCVDGCAFVECGSPSHWW